MPSQRDPYKVFAKIENWMQIQRADTPKLRCQEMWRTLRSIWRNQMTLEQVLVEYKKSARILRALTKAVLADCYAQSSRARWLCSLKTLVRIHCAILVLVARGERRHLNLVLRIGPLPIHLAAVLFEENSARWEPEWAPLVEQHLEKTEARMWREDAVQRDGLGLSYL